MNNLEEVLTSILFALGREISIEELSNTLRVDKEEIKNTLESMKSKYTGGINLITVNDKYQFVTNKDYYEYVKLFIEKSRREKLSISSLEVLTIIAYNPNITKLQVEKIRGINSDYAVNRLLEYGLIEVTGKLDVIGKPRIYGVTNEFYRSLGINSLEELPEYDKLKYNNGEDIVVDEQINLEENL